MAIISRAGVKEKSCSTCKKWKPLEDFYKDRTKGISQGGRHCRCKACHKNAYYKRKGIKQQLSFGGIMRQKTILLFILGTFLGGSLGATVVGYSQSGSHSLSSLTEEHAEISKMDWVIFHAQLNALTEILREQVHLPVSLLNYVYDADSDRIVSNALVDSSWLASTNLEAARDTFETRASSFCTQVMMSMVITGAGTTVIKDGKNICKVVFFEWVIGESGEIQRKEIAVYQNGQIVLK